MGVLDALTTSGDNSNTNALTGSISTSAPNEVLIMIVSSYAAAGHTQVSSIVSTSGVVWKLRNFIDTIAPGANELRVEEWWAPAPATLTADSFTIFLNITAHVSYSQVAVQGAANINAPFDPNPSLPGAVAYPVSTAGASQPISTNFANTVLLLGYAGAGFGNPAIGAPFTQAVSDRGTYNNSAIAYQVRGSQALNVQGAPNSNASSQLGVLSDAIYSPGPLRALPVTAGF